MVRKRHFSTTIEKSKCFSSLQKNDKYSVVNYRPILLPPRFGKIFERVLYNEMFDFFITNDLISTNHSGFQPGDFCFNQLLSITHVIYTAFYEECEVRGEFLRLIKDFLSDRRKRRVVLNGQWVSWMDVQARVPQGSLFGLLLYFNL